MIGARRKVAARRQVEPQIAVVGGEGTRKKAESQYDGNQPIIQPGSTTRRSLQRSGGWRR